MFNVFKKISAALSGKGLRRVPFAPKIYRFFYETTRPHGIVKTRVLGHDIFINAADSGIAPWLLTGKEFSHDERIVLEKLLKQGDVFADVGANIGYFSLVAARSVGAGGEVHAFEPDDEHFDLLTRNIKQNGYQNIFPVKKAVSDKSGVARFYRDPKNMCAHSLAKKEGGEVSNVETIPLDEYFKNKQVDIAKIDVEGFEPAVLRGMTEIFECNGNITLIFEFYPNAMKRSGEDPERFLRHLASQGFSLFRIDAGGALSNISESDFTVLARGDGMRKLINIVAKKES